MGYSVRQVEPRAARDAVVALWPRNQPTALPSRYPWYYLENPLGPGTVWLLQSDDGAGGSRVVGWTGYGPRRFYDEGRVLSAVDHADFAVDPEHRTLLPALMLQRKATDAAAEADFAYGFPNEHAVGIFRRLGYTPLGNMGRYVRILRRAEYIRRRLSVPVIPAVGGALLDGWAGRAERRASRAAGPVEWLDAFDDRFDALGERAREIFRFIGHRDAAFLAWRFGAAGGGPARIATMPAPDGASLRAYAVILEREPGVAQVADFLAVSREALADLLSAIVPPLRAAGFASIQVLYMGAPWVVAVLQAQGFVFRGAPRVVTARAGTTGAVDSAALLNPDNWFFTPADRDF